MTHTLRHIFNSLISYMKIRRTVPRLNIAQFSEHDLRDINLPPNYQLHLGFSHELYDWRTRVLR